MSDNMNTPIKQIKIIVRDYANREYTFEIKGEVSEAILDNIVNNIKTLIRQTIKEKQISQQEREKEKNVTSYEKVKNIIKTYLKDSYFTSYQIKEIYNEIYNEDIKITTISTYLNRLYEEGLLTRIRHGKRWIYSIRQEFVYQQI